MSLYKWFESLSEEKKTMFNELVEKIYREHYYPEAFPRWIDKDLFREDFTVHIASCIDSYYFCEGETEFRIDIEIVPTKQPAVHPYERNSKYKIPDWLINHIDSTYPDPHRVANGLDATQDNAKMTQEIKEKLSAIGLDFSEENIEVLKQLILIQNQHDVSCL